MTVPLPPIEEQRRIAAILDHADALRAKRRQVLAHLDTLTQSIFHDMFGTGPLATADAGDLMPHMRNGLSPASEGQYKASVLTLSAITQGEFDSTAVKVGMFAIDPPVDKRVTSADFLMCRGNGNSALVGAGVYSREDRPDLVFPDTVIAGRTDGSKVTLPFLIAAWRLPSVRRQIQAVARTTNGTYKVNQQTLSGVIVPLPPLALQVEFGTMMMEVDAHRIVAQRALASNNELFASLQFRAFRGDL